MGFDGQELAARWSIVAQLRKPGFSWDGGSYKANRNGSGDVQGLCSSASVDSSASHGTKRFPQSRLHERCIASGAQIA